MAKPRQTIFARGTANRRSKAGAIQGMVVSNLKEKMDQAKQVSHDTAEEAGYMILRNSLKYTPMDTGALRDSGEVNSGTTATGNTKVEITFGSQDVDYAVFVHEDMPRDRPKSYTTPGTGPKFLQKGASESVDAIDSLIKSRLRGVAQGGNRGGQ